MTLPIFAAEPELAAGVPGVVALTDDDFGDATLHAIRRRGGLVLVRCGTAYSTATHVSRARAVGAPVAPLPDAHEVAVWLLTAAGGWRQAALTDAVKRVEAVVSVAVTTRSRSCGLPEPGPRSLVARWAARAWRPCSWCDGGGVRRCVCARCGASLEPVTS